MRVTNDPVVESWLKWEPIVEPGCEVSTWNKKTKKGGIRLVVGVVAPDENGGVFYKVVLPGDMRIRKLRADKICCVTKSPTDIAYGFGSTK